jgi:hypothetical protein
MERNIKAAKELLVKYESITIDQITKVYNMIREQEEENITPSGYDVMERITGFSSIVKCILCQEAKKLVQKDNYYCQCCIYTINSSDDYLCVEETYKALGNAHTPEDIYNALQARIEFLKQSINIYEAQS